MTDREIVSIVIPVYNGSDYLDQAVRSALAQTWPATEVIVVDDGSTDDGATRRVAEKFGSNIKYVHQPNGGVAAALNRGIQEMEGSYFSWLSHDDLYAPRKVEEQIKVARAYDEDVIVFGDYDNIDAGNKFLYRVAAGEDYVDAKPLWAVLEGRLNGCTLLIPKACLDSVGGFDVGMPTTQDYDLWFRLALQYRFVHSPGVFVRHRVHPNQGSASPRHIEEASLLWMSLLERVPPENMVAYEGSAYGFLRRADRFLEQSGYENAKIGVKRLLRSARRSLDPTVLVHCPAEPSLLLRLERSLRQARLERAKIIVIADSMINLELDDVMSTSKTFRHSCLVDNRHVAAAELFREVLRRSKSEFFFLADETLNPEDIDAQIDMLLGRPGADGVLIGTADESGRFGLLSGALLTRAAVERAVARMTPTTPLAHAIAMEARLRVLNPASKAVRPGRGTAFDFGNGPAAEKQPIGDAARSPALASRLSEVRPQRHDYFITAHGRTRLRRAGRKLLAQPVVGRTVLRFANSLYKRAKSDDRRRAIDLLTRDMFGLSSDFDADWYLARYSDVQRAGVAPGVHYISHGFREGRARSPEGGAPLAPSTNPERLLLAGVERIHLPLEASADRRQRTEVVARQSQQAVEALSKGFVTSLPVQLVLLHSWGGGTHKYAKILAEHFSGKANFLFGWGVEEEKFYLSSDLPATKPVEFDIREDFRHIIALLTVVGVSRVDVLHTIGMKDHVAKLLAALQVPYDITFLDYDLVAKNPHLISSMGEFVSDDEDALRNLATSRFHDLIRRADRRIACSRDLATRLLKFVHDVEIVTAVLPEPHRPDRFSVYMPPITKDEPLRVLVPGALHAHKGKDRVIGAINAARAHGYPLRFFLLGQGIVPLEDQHYPTVVHLGLLSEETLAHTVCSLRPHLAWFPFLAPETHSFTLSEVMLTGLPILASDIGASAERLAGRRLSWLLPWETSGARCAQALAELHDGNWSFARHAECLPRIADAASAFYETEYLRPSTYPEQDRR